MSTRDEAKALATELCEMDGGVAALQNILKGLNVEKFGELPDSAIPRFRTAVAAEIHEREKTTPTTKRVPDRQKAGVGERPEPTVVIEIKRQTTLPPDFVRRLVCQALGIRFDSGVKIEGIDGDTVVEWKELV